MKTAWCKRSIATVLLLVLAAVTAAMPLCAAAETEATTETTDSMSISSKIYSLKMNDTEGVIEQSPSTPAFWEYPLLRAGEDLAEGVMVVRNDSAVSATMVLSPIRLAFGDEAKLTYLNHLHLTIKEGEQVLFDDTYAHINDPDGGFTLRYDDMQPGEEHAYTIKMRCSYSYDGNPNTDSSVMPWTFLAQRQTILVDEQQQETPDWVIPVLSVTGGVIGVLIVVKIITVLVAGKKKKKIAAQIRADIENGKNDAQKP